MAGDGHRPLDIVREADAQAEGLIGLVRMALAVVLAGALLLATNAAGRPESAEYDQRIGLAALMIGSYFLVGLATQLIVRAGRYRMWMAWLGALLDVMLISANVWFSTRAAGVSSLYALASPAALMIPLILTFGALRFRPSIQIAMSALTGVVVLLILFSNQGDGDDQKLLAYLDATYGIAPNLMRALMMVMTGAVVAVAVWRARRLLERVAAESEQRMNLTRFLPRAISNHMNDDGLRRLRSGRHMRLAIMFIDIRGFTHAAEQLSPEATSALLTDYRALILDAAEAHGGMVDKFIGDGALVLFGVSGAPEEAASQAVTAAQVLLGRIEHWNAERGRQGHEPVAVGIGVHLGDVVVGAIGDERRLEFTVVGDEVNVAARVEDATKGYGLALLATAAVIDKAEESAVRHGQVHWKEQWRDLGEAELRGRARRVRLWGNVRYRFPNAAADACDPAERVEG